MPTRYAMIVVTERKMNIDEKKKNNNNKQKQQQQENEVRSMQVCLMP